MKLLHLLVDPPVMGLLLLFSSILWMLKDERDKTRPILVIALVLNLFYGFLLNTVMGKVDSLLPWKYDYYLYRVDVAVGVSAASVATTFQGVWRNALNVAYQLMLPMMILWLVVARKANARGSVVVAYAAEMIVGPMFYAALPAVGPAATFGTGWLQPYAVPVHAARLSGMPNAFPSLHLATALVLVLFARRRLWRCVSLAFFVATALATLTTGEHYVIDLIAGLAFGCFAANVAYRQICNAIVYLGLVFGWFLAIRFGCNGLIVHSLLAQSFAVLTIAAASHAVWKNWSNPPQPKREYEGSLETEPLRFRIANNRQASTHGI